jgi:hypothetical protein
MTTDWPAALDALEEWLRRAGDALEQDGPTAPPVTVPGSPVPDELRLRATVLLQRMGDLETEALRRRTRLRRAQTYQH